MAITCVRLLKNIEITKAMLKRGCQVDARQPGIDRTALHEAVLSSDIALVTLLLDYGADPNAMDKFHLHYVYDRDRKHTDERLEVVKLLIAKGASTVTTTDESSWSRVDPVLRYGNVNANQTLLGANIDLTREDENGNTPVHILTMSKNSEAFKALNDKHFEIDACNLEWETPLLIAATYGNACAVELLLEKDADVHAAYNGNSLPIQKCIEQFPPELEKQYMKCIQLLLEYGAEFQHEFYMDEEPSTVFNVVEEKQIYGVGNS